MTASEFALLQRTSVVTLSICGIFKEVVTIAAAGIFFDDSLTPINVSGLLITIACIAAYNYLKITKMKQVARLELEKRHEVSPDDENEAEPNVVSSMLEHETRHYGHRSMTSRSREDSRSSTHKASAKRIE